MSKEFDFIRDAVPRPELLAQLAEEACELGHTALKLRRALDGTNPTPVSVEAAEEALREELADVALLLGLCVGDILPVVLDQAPMKLWRWRSRLEEAAGGDADGKG